MVDVKIYVMTHKKYNLLDNDLYTPLFVGAEGKEETFGYLRDDVGDNISSKNDAYSENKGLYWIWKNSTAEIIGLNHYKLVLIVWHTDPQMLLTRLGCRFSLSYGHKTIACFLNLPRSHNLAAGPSVQPAYYPDLLQSK